MQQLGSYQLSHRFQNKLKFDIVYHLPSENQNVSALKRLFYELKKQGIDSIHFDWKWKDIQPGLKFEEGPSLNYRKAIEAMIEVGMDSPTIILSNPPAWVLKLYSSSRKEFRRAFREYLFEVKRQFEKMPKVKISRVQIFNELNNVFYTPIDKEDLLSLFADARLILFDYNPQINLVLSLLAGNLTEIQAELPVRFKEMPILRKIPFQKSIWGYLEFFKDQRALFDVVSISHYPGVWHLPVKESFAQKATIKSIFKTIFTQLQFLEQIFEEIASWGMDYEIGEIGFPTHSFWGDQMRQVEAYKLFSEEIRNMLTSFKKKGLRPLSRITFYELIDDSPDSFAKSLLKLTPYPEYNWGLITRDGKPKKILKNDKSSSHLSNIIQSMRS